MNYQCPVCGFNQMQQPPRDHFICPCCGTQFGYDDAALSHNDLRDEWIKNGHRWFSDSTPQPIAWNWVEQVLLIAPITNYPGSVEMRRSLTKVGTSSQISLAAARVA